MYYQYKVLQVMLLQDWLLQVTQPFSHLYWSPPTLHPNCIVNYTVEIMTTSDNILISNLNTSSNVSWVYLHYNSGTS